MSKYSSTSEYIKVNNEIWPINAGFTKRGYSLAIYTKQMRKIIEQLNVMTDQYSRVFVVVFELHLDRFTDDNQIMTDFKERLFRSLRQKYKLNDIGYAWCREIERAKQQHYHMGIFVEGRKVRNPHYLWEIMQDIWWRAGGGYMPKGTYHMINRNDYQSKQDAIYHLSYLAKVRGKGKAYRPMQTKDYSTSRLKPKT